MKYNVYNSEQTLAEQIVNDVLANKDKDLKVIKDEIAEFLHKFAKHNYEDGYDAGIDANEDWIG